MPISSFYGLQTSLRGLLAQQASIDVTGHNIANVNTPGYSRQTAELQASRPYAIPAMATGSGGGAQLGSGVNVQAYNRVRDQFLDANYRAQNMRDGYATQMAETLGDAETALAEPGDDGIAAQLASYWDAWSDLANDPSDSAARQAVIQQGKTLAGSFSTIDSQLTQLSASAAAEYADLTGPDGKIAGIAKELGQLNDSISKSLQVGATPNDAMDRRDLLIDQLSEFGQVSATENPNGTMTIAFGDAAAPLVEGKTVTWPQTLTAPNGKLGALKTLSDPAGTLAGYRTAISATAKSLADSVNAIHGTPPFFSYTAGNEAASLAVNVTANQIVTTTGANAGANDLAAQVAALRSGAADSSYRTFVTGMGNDVASANREAASASALANSVATRRDSVSGVSLDEEMTNLIKFQRAYQASARAMSTMDEALDVLINRTGRVGL